MKRILLVVGTRPEAIKMAPLIKLMQTKPEIELIVCNSGQHAEMIDQVFELFEIKPDINLKVMGKTSTLSDLYSLLLSEINRISQRIKPDMIFVHGDTATAAASSMVSLFNRIDCIHIEAGLRTGDIFNPWPEEFNRKLIGMVTKKHFAPTPEAKANLLKEEVDPEKIFVTGNTVIDALLLTTERLRADANFKENFSQTYPFISDKSKKTILVTAHRRENLESGGIKKICTAISRLIKNNSDVQVVFPVHLNPKVQNIVREKLGQTPRVHLIDPLDYKDFVFMMDSSYLVITDSGGIQEEAPSLGKPVLVTRETTERPEAVVAGTARLVGTDPNQIVYWTELLLNDSKLYYDTSQISNPYGDGQACERIVGEIIKGPSLSSENRSINL